MEASLKKVEGCENTATLSAQLSASDDLKKQREDFTKISSDIISFMKNADIEQGTMYVQYCPMANSGKGGSWISASEEIKNPYYGEEMLTCGEVKETFTKK